MERVGDADCFKFREEIKAILPTLSAHTTVFHAAKRGVEVSDKPTIDPDEPGPDFVGGMLCFVDVLGPDGAAEAVLGPVDHGDRLIKGLECLDGEHWPKDFFLDEAALLRNIDDKSWL